MSTPLENELKPIQQQQDTLATGSEKPVTQPIEQQTAEKVKPVTQPTEQHIAGSETKPVTQSSQHGEHHHKEHHHHSGEHHHKEHHSHSGEHHHKDHHSHSSHSVKEVKEIKIGANEINHHYVYNKHPTDQFTEDVFRFEQTEIPRDPSTENEILVRLTYIAVDPFIRNRMSEKRDFIQPFKLNDVLEGEATAEIVKSNNPKYPVGQNIVGYFAWTRYQIINVKNLPVNLIPHDIHPSYFLSMFGMPGLTAYFGVTEYAKLKPQHNVLVSGACGSVGLFVAQIMRITGCNKLIGLDSNDEKAKQSLLFGYNECHNTASSSSEDLHQLLKTCFPDGIDVYWDNVGGPLLDAVIEHMRPHGRIIMCGTKADCHVGDQVSGITKFDRIIAKSLTLQGLFYYEFCERFPKAYKKLLHWYHDGKLKTKETTLEGFQHIPKAFISLMKGDTLGKTIVHVEPAQVA